MRILRYLLCGYFWLLSVFIACTVVIVEPSILLKSMTTTGSIQVTVHITTAVAMIVATFVFAKAWWVLWHEQLPARTWCVAASIVSFIAPAIFMSLDILAGSFPGFWQRVGFFMVPPLAIGIGGILFGLSDAAKPLPPATRPHLGHAILTSVLSLYFGFGFVSGVVWGSLQFMRHKHLQTSYFTGIALCGFLFLATLLKLKQDLRKRRVETTASMPN